MIRDVLKTEIEKALTALGVDYSGLEINLEHPADFKFGDYSTNIAMMVAKQLEQNPKDLAEKIAEQIRAGKNKNIKDVQVAGPGFINFYLSNEFFAESIRKVAVSGPSFVDVGFNKKLILEYSSPNIAKPFTIGHLRSTIIGAALANILKTSGFDVVRENYLGNWGTQFGKLIVAIKKGDLKSKLKEVEQSENPIRYLVDLYVKFHQEAETNPDLEEEARQEFKKLEDGDKQNDEIWRSCIALSLAEFNKIYLRLGLASGFDRYTGERESHERVNDVYKILEENELITVSEEAWIVELEKFGLPPLLVRKKDGSSIYAVRDLASDLVRREKYGKDIMIVNEVGSEQMLYFRQLFAVEKILGWFKEGERVHVSHGLYSFKDGKMSTRKGNVIWLDKVLDEARSRSLRKIIEGDDGQVTVLAEGVTEIDRSSVFGVSKLADEVQKLKVAEAVGIGAIKYNDLKREASRDIIFDWDDILNLKGNSGPYLQYTYARANSVLIKSGKSIKDFCVEEESQVSRMVHIFPEIVERAANEYAPHHICTYLYNLASAFNSYYAQNKIIGSENEAYRLALTKAVAQVLESGLNLLGIPVLSEM